MRKTLSIGFILGFFVLLAPFQLYAETTDATPPPQLTQDHVRYLNGYPDRTMQPNKQLSRAEAASIIYHLLVQPGVTENTYYSDVAANQWYAPYVNTLCALGLFDQAENFYPATMITRAEIVDALIRLRPDASTDTVPGFSDVPADYWAARQIATAVSLGWISGYPDGSFHPDQGLTRAEACTIVNRACARSGDAQQARVLLGLGLYRDVPVSHWAGTAIAEASVAHTPAPSDAGELWTGIDYAALRFRPGVQSVDNVLYSVNRYGTLLCNQRVGASQANERGQLSLVQGGYVTPTPYISMLDGLNATVACEPISALMGLRAKGYATNVTPRQFLKALPYSQSNPEYGFVGSPYYCDGRYSSINPRPLTAFCNRFCPDAPACQNFSGSNITKLRQELLAGNVIVSYQTYWWQPIQYGNFIVDGRYKAMVNNNHVRLVCGYDPAKGYFVSDPYNPHKRGQSYQYWVKASTFDSLWNQRKMGMVIR